MKAILGAKDCMTHFDLPFTNTGPCMFYYESFFHNLKALLIVLFFGHLVAVDKAINTTLTYYYCKVSMANLIANLWKT